MVTARAEIVKENEITADEEGGDITGFLRGSVPQYPKIARKGNRAFSITSSAIARYPRPLFAEMCSELQNGYRNPGPMAGLSRETLSFSDRRAQ
jgi:hypothetical protein